MNEGTKNVDLNSSDSSLKNLNDFLGCVKFRVKSRTKYQIKCLKMISKMTQKFLSKIKSEQIINKICLFILFRFKKI